MPLSRTAEDTSPLDAEPAEAALDDGVPQQLGRFQLLERLGAGGMGVVYRARDPQLDRDVALKLLSTRHGHSPERIEQLISEARAMAQISHPNVLGIFEVEAGGPYPFIVLELVAGGTLREWLETSKPSREQVLEAFSQAGTGLLAAHRAGLVHRDFKPDNVLCDEDGRVRVTDFGLASTVPSQAPEPLAEQSSADLDTTRLTHSGVIVGTPAYMAPEQYRGTTVDARADQFAFCVALHEALCGARPFPGRNVSEVRKRVLAGEAEIHAAKLSPRLRAVLKRGLSREPEARFDTLAPILEEMRAPPAAKPRALGPIIAVALGVGVAAIAFASTTREAEPAAPALAPASASAVPAVVNASASPVSASAARPLPTSAGSSTPVTAKAVSPARRPPAPQPQRNKLELGQPSAQPEDSRRRRLELEQE